MAFFATRLGWHQIQQLGPHHLLEHACRQRVRLGVVPDVDVQPVHHIEMRIGEQLLHGRIAHLGCNPLPHERLKVRSRREWLHIVQRGQGGLLRGLWLRRNRGLRQGLLLNCWSTRRGHSPLLVLFRARFSQQPPRSGVLLAA